MSAPTARAALIVVALAFGGIGPAFCQSTAPAAAGPAMSSVLSPACEAPATDIAEPGPLPAVTAKLEHKQPVRILAIGSSSTYGIGASTRSHTYPSQLEGLLRVALKDVDVQVVNRGVSGEVARNTALRIRSEVALNSFDLVLWQLGTNDALTRVSPDDFTDTVDDTIDWLRDNGVDVVLVGLQYTAKLARDDNYVAIRQALQKIVVDKKVPFVRRYEAMQFIARARANQQMMAGDDFHLNDLGYRCMAEHVANAVVTDLFVKRFRPAGN